ncbi:MAG: Holliday junction resolvase RuvX, partial [Muribaculaceae bacterium]|nr:Holliday junction resolvase RuvX [Muribaculaceae bacterium]
KEDVEEIVIGQPKTLRNEPSESMKYINPFLGQLRKELPDMKVTMFDERFTSSIAHREMLAAGMKKSDRQRKELADEMAATIILTDYLQSRQFGSLF